MAGAAVAVGGHGRTGAVVSFGERTV